MKKRNSKSSSFIDFSAPYMTLVLIALLFIACGKDSKEYELPELGLMEIPLGFLSIEVPEGNEFTFERYQLGKELFYDKIFSKDGKISCASCHKPQLAFSDDVALSIGAFDAEGTRNAPTLANVVLHPYLTREGGVPTLEQQILVPIQEHNEFANNIILIADTLAKIEKYVEMSKLAYDQAPNHFVITRALSVFERSLISGQSVYDAEINYGLNGAMNDAAKKGMDLFFGKAQCGNCHSGYNFTNYNFENNGLYESYEDEGRAKLTQESEDVALFKVPTLRNIEVTGPYMHDGSFNSLEEVIDHYNFGGYSHPNKSEFIAPLGLDKHEKDNLKAFLLSLTDENFLKNKVFKNE